MMIYAILDSLNTTAGLSQIPWINNYITISRGM